MIHPVSLFPFVLCSFCLPVSWTSFWCGGVCLFLLCVRCVISRCMNLGWSRCAWYVLRGGEFSSALFSCPCSVLTAPSGMGSPCPLLASLFRVGSFRTLSFLGVWIEFWIRLCLTDPTDGISSLFVSHWFCPRNLVFGQLVPI